MNPTLEQIFDAIREMRARYPGWRFGKIVCNVAMWARGPVPEAVWDVEDEEFVAAAREHLEKRKRVLSGEACQPSETIP